VTPRRAYRTGLLIAAGLAIAASTFLTTIGAWLVGSLWRIVAAVVAYGTWLLRPAPRAARVSGASGLIPLLVFLTWEGGLFYLPAALALVVAQAWMPATPKPAPQSRGTGSG
jgi:hypothetical protein